jgi:hypothetical protein
METVPQVDVEDIKLAWSIYREPFKLRRGKLGAVCGPEENPFKPGTDARAVTHRAFMLSILVDFAIEQPDMPVAFREDPLPEIVFRTLAEIPMEWLGQKPRGWPFDLEELARRLLTAN